MKCTIDEKQVDNAASLSSECVTVDFRLQIKCEMPHELMLGVLE